MEDDNQRPPPNLGPDRDPEDNTPGSLFSSRSIIVLLLIFLGVFLAIKFLDYPSGPTIPYSELKDKIRQGQVESVEISDQTIIATPTEKALKAAKKKKKNDSSMEAWRSVRVEGDEKFVDLLEKHGVEYKAEYKTGCEGSSIWLWIAPLIVMVLLWSFFMRRLSGLGGRNSPAMNFGKSQADVHLEEGTGVTFNDVAGCEEAKEELQEVIEFLRSPEKFTRLGGQVPKGVLLVGPPGTGKTLLARAVAGEADVPFFNLSGSDFVEMFVGVGAARVRDLFEKAKEKSPCIIFVDELDAIGKQRGQGGFQGNDEREQTLNALLVEMDGFDSRTGVILLALLRAGRFDRHIAVDRPSKRGREEILEVHTRGVVVGDDVDLEVIAAQTAGMVGSDLANAVNEAALLAARRDKDEVEMEDFQDAIERVMAGLEKTSRRLTDKERDIVAHHEAGHAVVAAAVEHADRVHKVSIVSRGIGALGYTLQVPLEDRTLMTRNELRDKISTLLGGRGAETIIFGDISTGASNDLQRVTDIARRMIREFGMSDTIGNVSYSEEGGEQNSAPVSLGGKDYSEETAEAIDREVHQVIETLFERTLAILRKNRDVLEDMADYLKDEEVLDGEELEQFLDRVAPLSDTEEVERILESSGDRGPDPELTSENW
ncbi:MAG: ATP-dependent zinc metalloprotease FtsH [Bradymonadaceae bacterium]